MRAELPTGTVTFLFTDIEGSTRLLHALGPAAYAEALAEHRRLLRGAFARRGGVEIDTQGDAFFVAFPTAAAAAGAAQDGQEALAGGPIRVRMGLHTGAPIVTSEGYVGVDVHRGARVAALARGGQVLLTEATSALLGDTPLTDLGRHRLKDFDRAVRLWQLGTERFPALHTPGAVSLPTPATSFVGRDRELFDAVATWLEREPRVLTIVGPGGTGKTRFAIELARLLAEEADGGTVFVPFAPVADAALLLPSVAERLGAAGNGPDAVAAVVGEKRMHAVLDNLEHLLPEAARTIAQLVAAAPQLRLIVTSREPLRIAGEAELDLPPLTTDEAIALFVMRGRDVRSDLVEVPAIAELCDRLDRLPLAIELAAARTKLMGPEALLERLGERLDLLKGTRDAEERHATLRATIAWSHDLLDAEERSLFARLSIFAGGCTVESAEATCDADIDVLASLLDKSLVRRRTGEYGEERVWMLETIREFAHEQLRQDSRPEEFERRHAMRMLEIVRDANLTDGAEPLRQRHDVVLAERDDVRKALDWARIHDPLLGIELCVALESYWAASDPVEGAERLEALLAHAGPLPAALEAAAHRVYGGTLYRLGEFERGTREHERSRDLFRALGDERDTAALEGRLAVDAAYFGELDVARPAAERVLALARSLAMPRLEAEALGALATIARREERLEDAYRLEGESAQCSEASGFVWWTANALMNRMELALRLEKLGEADEHGRRALHLARSIDDRLVILWVLAGFALLETRRGRLDRAGWIWGSLTAEIARRPLPQASLFEEFSEPLANTDDPAFRTALDAGATEDLAAAVAFVLEDDQTEP